MKVLTINIEFGGYYLYAATGRSFGYVDRYVDLIRKHDIDVVCFQEAIFLGARRTFDITKRIAARLGYFHKAHKHHYLSMVSRYPLTRVGGGHGSPHPFLTCRLVDQRGRAFTISNVHLNDEPFTYYSLLSIPYNNTPADLTPQQAVDLSYEAKRDDLTAMLKHHATPDGVDVVCGDFNEMSHLDKVRTRGAQRRRRRLPWRCSRLMRRHGFVDAARVKWKRRNQYTCDVVGTDNPPMRIDYVYVRGASVSDVQYLSGLKWKGRHMSDHVPVLATLVDA